MVGSAPSQQALQPSPKAHATPSRPRPHRHKPQIASVFPMSICYIHARQFRAQRPSARGRLAQFALRTVPADVSTKLQRRARKSSPLFFGFQEPRRVRRATEPVRREIPLPARHGEAHRGSSSPRKAVVRRGVCFRPRHALVESLRRKIHGEESPEIVCIQTNFLRLFRIYINNRN